jgi:hypothetical protein
LRSPAPPCRLTDLVINPSTTTCIVINAGL